MQRKYLKETPLAKGAKNFYGSFKTWLITKYPLTGEPSEEEWQVVLADDTEIYPSSGLDINDDLEENETDSINATDQDLFNDTLSYDTLSYNIQS